jgi:LmbE family N-acetylglucosaminyl deacetylase
MTREDYRSPSGAVRMDAAAHADRTVSGQGTPIEEWQRSPAWNSVPVVDAEALVPPGHRLLIIAPHPDDEVLGAGALIHDARRAGREVQVLAVTNGEGSHPGSRDWLPQNLAAARAAESEQALKLLGLEPTDLVRLDFADGSLARQGAEVSRVLVQRIRPDDVVVTPWRYDGHPDHEIVANAVLDVLAITAATHLEAPIWGLHWARPEQDAFPWERACRLPLDPYLRERKRAAVECFSSQLSPDESTGRDAVLPPWALDRLVSDRELYFR